MHTLFCDGDCQPASASAHLGFRITTTLRRLLQAGELSAYVRSGPDLRATYLDVAPKGRPTLRQHVQAHTSCRGNSPLWGADYESWPKPSGNWTDIANSYLDLPQWGPPPWTELSINGSNIQQLVASGHAQIYWKYAHQCAWSR